MFQICGMGISLQQSFFFSCGFNSLSKHHNNTICHYLANVIKKIHMEVVIMLLFDFNLDFSIVSPDFGGRSSRNVVRFTGVTRKVLSYSKHTLPCSCEHQVWSGSIYFERLKTYLAAFGRTQAFWASENISSSSKDIWDSPKREMKFTTDCSLKCSINSFTISFVNSLSN